MNSANMQIAEKLGHILFSNEIIKNSHGCPFCGCEIARMEEKGFICTLCHGHFSIDSNGNSMKIKEGEIMGTPEHALLHKEWLKGMKHKFLEERKEILKAVDRYKDVGEWIEP
jgi:hypothetical protein